MNREIEYPRYLPKVDRGYDPVLGQWVYPPRPVLWHYKPQKKKNSSWLDTLCGVIGITILGLMFAMTFLNPWI